MTSYLAEGDDLAALIYEQVEVHLPYHKGVDCGITFEWRLGRVGSKRRRRSSGNDPVTAENVNDSFIYRSGGADCRWDMTYRARIEEQIDKRLEPNRGRIGGLREYSPGAANAQPGIQIRCEAKGGPPVSQGALRLSR